MTVKVQMEMPRSKAQRGKIWKGFNGHQTDRHIVPTCLYNRQTASSGANSTLDRNSSRPGGPGIQIARSQSVLRWNKRRITGRWWASSPENKASFHLKALWQKSGRCVPLQPGHEWRLPSGYRENLGRAPEYTASDPTCGKGLNNDRRIWN